MSKNNIQNYILEKIKNNQDLKSELIKDFESINKNNKKITIKKYWNSLDPVDNFAAQLPCV